MSRLKRAVFADSTPASGETDMLQWLFAKVAKLALAIGVATGAWAG